MLDLDAFTLTPGVHVLLEAIRKFLLDTIDMLSIGFIQEGSEDRPLQRQKALKIRINLILRIFILEVFFFVVEFVLYRAC